jgi:hypothetical protein
MTDADDMSHLAAPQLELFARLSVQVAPPIELGDTLAGQRHLTQVTNVAAETLYVGYQTSPTRWATERLIGLVHHVRVGQSSLPERRPYPCLSHASA